MSELKCFIQNKSRHLCIEMVAFFEPPLNSLKYPHLAAKSGFQGFLDLLFMV